MLVENFATGVMDRLGLGAAALQQRNPELIYVSASGLGRTGPESHAVAYGTLLQCYAGFAGLNRHPDVPPRVGFAWLDPMCGLMLAFIVAAALWQRRRQGGVARVDFSMIEAMLWTTGGAAARRRNVVRRRYRKAIDPIGTGCTAHFAVRATTNGLRSRSATMWNGKLCAASCRTLCNERRLPSGCEPSPRRAQRTACRVPAFQPPRLPVRWTLSAASICARGDSGMHTRAAFCLACRGARASADRPARHQALGADTDAVLLDILGLPRDEIAALHRSGALSLRGTQ